MELDDIKDEVVKKGTWYLKNRTKIWATVWFLMGLIGGNPSIITQYIPTLKYSTPEVQQKLQEYQELKEKLIEIKKDIDELKEKEV